MEQIVNALVWLAWVYFFIGLVQVTTTIICTVIKMRANKEMNGELVQSNNAVSILREENKKLVDEHNARVKRIVELEAIALRYAEIMASKPVKKAGKKAVGK